MSGANRADRADLWRRLWLTLGALIVFRVGTYIPIPGVDAVKVGEFIAFGETGIIGLLDTFGGGGFRRFSIFALGIAPYVSAFVIIQLLSAVVPRLGRLAAEGPAGRRALNQYARVLTVALAGLQAYGLGVAIGGARGFIVAPSHGFAAIAVVTLVAGTTFLMWLGEQITERGIGSGMLLILACGAADRLPASIAIALGRVRAGGLDVHWLYAALLMAVAVLALVVFIEGAVRWMPVHGPAGALGTDTPAGDYVRLPLRINPSGILAPLAASVFAPSLWAIILYVGGRDTHPLMDLARNGVGYGIVDGLLIALLAVCCGLASADSAQIAGVLKDSGGWIPGCRPGEDTARALRRTQVVLAFFCVIYLPAACVLPYVIAKQFQLPLALSDFSFFLLIWVMLRVLEQARLVLRS